MIHLQHTSDKSKAYVEITDLNGNTKIVEMMQCVHCQVMWVLKPGSGRKRGWCTKCGGVTCGQEDCDTCVPLLKRMGYE